MPQIDDKYYSGCTNRKDDVIINRLRIGHTRLTHSFRMENRPHPPLCDQCEGHHELTVKHILIKCNFLKIIRRRHYDVTDLNQLFNPQTAKILSSHKGPTWASEAHLAFFILYEQCKINFDPHSFVLLTSISCIC